MKGAELPLAMSEEIGRSLKVTDNNGTFPVTSAMSNITATYGHVATPGPSVHGFYRQVLEWVPYPPPGDLPDPKVATSHVSLWEDSSH